MAGRGKECAESGADIFNRSNPGGAPLPAVVNASRGLRTDDHHRGARGCGSRLHIVLEQIVDPITHTAVEQISAAPIGSHRASCGTFLF